MQPLDVALKETEELRTGWTSFLQVPAVGKSLAQTVHPGDPFTSLHFLVIQKVGSFKSIKQGHCARWLNLGLWGIILHR